MNKISWWVPLISSLSCAPLTTPPEKSVDYCLIDVSSDKILAPYSERLKSNPHLLEVIDFCRLPVLWQEQMWDKIQDSEIKQQPPTAPLPASFNNLKPNQNSSLNPSRSG